MLETYSILDRFELLYPENSNVSNLRRAYIDRDLSSIFKLANSDVDELRKAVIEKNMHSVFRLVESDEYRDKIEDLRKAVLDQNLHSIFRLLGNDDLRKLVLDDNTWSLWKLLDEYVDTYFVQAFKSFYVNQLDYDNDCFSRGQLQSKLWLVNELQKLDLDLGTVFLCAGWYATLATMLFENKIKVSTIRSFDLDPSCVSRAEVFNKPWVIDDWKFKSSVADILDIDYNMHTFKVFRSDGSECELTESPDTIINTSCEHIANFDKWYGKIPSGKFVILQGNNYFDIPEHVNCATDLKEFDNNAQMQTTLYIGELQLPKYTRFMKIGIK